MTAHPAAWQAQACGQQARASFAEGVSLWMLDAQLIALLLLWPFGCLFFFPLQTAQVKFRKRVELGPCIQLIQECIAAGHLCSLGAHCSDRDPILTAVSAAQRCHENADQVCLLAELRNAAFMEVYMLPCREKQCVCVCVCVSVCARAMSAPPSNGDAQERM